jgi:hypothetical protein
LGLRQRRPGAIDVLHRIGKACRAFFPSEIAIAHLVGGIHHENRIGIGQRLQVNQWCYGIHLDFGEALRVVAHGHPGIDCSACINRADHREDGEQ